MKSVILSLSLAALVLACPAHAGKKKGKTEGAVSSEALQAPAGFIQMRVIGITETPMGPAVILTSMDRERLLPVWVGETEAATIGMRHDGKRMKRPLTHDLLDEVLTSLGGEVVDVRIDALKDAAFTAQVQLRPEKGKVVTLEARASDAIALALGHDLPVWVAEGVIEEASFDPGKLPVPKPPKKGDGVSL